MKTLLQFSLRSMTTALFVILLLIISQPAHSQITISSDDMPSSGDTIRKSNAISTGSVDYTLTGENYNWDFTELFPLFQTIDEYKSVGSVPFLYQLVFIPIIVANLAQEYPGIDTLGLPIADPYRFFKNSSSSFTDVGFAITVSDIPVPLKFNNADVIYDFPLNYGDEDSSNSGVDFGIPDLGFISIDRYRENEVDGWGTLTTSYGNFDVLRVKSTVEETDSIYIDSLGFGTALDRNYIEYKWLANGHSTPLLHVTEEGALLTVVWSDSVFDPSTGIEESQGVNNTFSIAPNPMLAEGKIVVYLTESNFAEITIYDLSGMAVSQLYSGELTKGESQFSINREASKLRNGMYFVQFKTKTEVITRKLIVQ